MKRIVTTLGTLALAFSLGSPVFAATAAKAPKAQDQTKTATAKPQAKKMSKKSSKATGKTTKASVKPAKASVKPAAKSTMPQQK
jgi:hypothetical protein